MFWNETINFNKPFFKYKIFKFNVFFGGVFFKKIQ